MAPERFDSRANLTGESYDSSYYAPLFAIEHKHFWFQARNRVIGALIGQITRTLSPGYHFLEVGCGTGNVLQLITKQCPQGLIVGMDLFAEGLRFARQRTDCPLVQGDMHSYPFKRPFEIIGLFDVLEHLENDIEILSLLKNRLTPNGTLLLTVPAHQALWSYFDEAACHVRRYSVSDLKLKLETAGYRIDYITQYMACIFPLVWLERRIKSRVSSPSVEKTEQLYHLATRELQIIPVVNDLLAWLLGQEVHAINRRWQLPIGTSLLAIARNYC